MGLYPETRFRFGYTVRFQAFCLDVLETFANAGMRDSFGSCIFRENREKSGSTIRLAGNGWKPSGGKCLLFFS